MMCEGKKPFTKRDAQTAANARRRDRRNPNPFLRIYECRICGYWHLTSRPIWGRPNRFRPAPKRRFYDR